MKQTIRYQSLLITGKLKTEVRITIDDLRSPEYTSISNGDKYTSVTFYPVMSISLIKPAETDENGQRQRIAWNPNDNLGMTKYNLPIFLNELSGIQTDMKIPEMYTYADKQRTRLELNEAAAAKARRVFVIGNMTIELSVCVITQLDDRRVEGIKMKFNNEQSSVLLTLNDIEALVDNLRRLDLDSVALLMYLNYITKPNKPRAFDASNLDPNPKPLVDIAPINKVVREEFLEIGEKDEI